MSRRPHQTNPRGTCLMFRALPFRPQAALPKAVLPKAVLLVSAAALAFAAAPAFAQDAVRTAPAGRRQVDGEKILQLLVAKGVISQADADGIEAQATVTPPAAAPVVAGGVNGDVQTIPYIPETVRKQIKNELREEVKAEAKSEGWASPGLVPDWLGKVTLEGDIRVRDEQDLFDKNNDNAIVNFNGINTGSPFDINYQKSGGANPPYLNTTEDRNRPRVRARFGLIAQPDDWVSFEVRLATGNDSSPVSPNQTLGAVGDFSKYAAWFDRFDMMLTPHGAFEGLRLDFGRGENPFWSTPLQFYPDLNFDGFYARYRRQVVSGLEGFGTIGVFPMFNTALNFSSNDVGAFKSHDSWMYGAQFGAAYQPTKAVKLTAAAGYYDFDGVAGKTSSPCNWFQTVCDTDTTRTPFAQWGNSMFPIRNITPDPTNPANSANPQYFGLASDFRVLDVHAAVDFTGYASLPVRLEGDFLQNLAFDKSRVLAREVNVAPADYTPGGMGYLVNLTLGKPVIARSGDWNFSAGYRYLESDATVDAIADADFHLGGTNAKGYTLSGYYGFAKNTSIGLRWFSADVITGPRYSNDVLQLDLNTKF